MTKYWDHHSLWATRYVSRVAFWKTHWLVSRVILIWWPFTEKECKRKKLREAHNSECIFRVHHHFYTLTISLKSFHWFATIRWFSLNNQFKKIERNLLSQNELNYKMYRTKIIISFKDLQKNFGRAQPAPARLWRRHYHHV